MGYVGADLQLRQGVQAGGAMSFYEALRSCTAYVPEIPEIVITFNPLFIQGARTILWGRRDVMMQYDVAIMESRRFFSITPVATPSADTAPP